MKKRAGLGAALILLGIALLLLWGEGRDLAPAEKWVARYNGPGNGADSASAIAVDGAGNIYVTGESEGSSSDYDYATVKYNKSGKQLWAKRYNGPGNGLDKADAMAVDGAGYVYVTGFSTGQGTGWDMATIKYAPNGKQLWVARFNGPGNDSDSGSAIAVDGSGNVYVTGQSTGTTPYGDMATLKYDANGKQLWVQRYDGPAKGMDLGSAIAVDSSGNVHVCGLSRGIDVGWDFITIKYNKGGKRLWVQRYNGPDNDADRASDLAVDAAGNVYVSGPSEGLYTGWDYATIKYGPNGKQLWLARYNGPINGSDQSMAVALDGSGNIHVVGTSPGYGTGDDIVTIKYDTTGKELWLNRYNGPASGGDEWARDIAVDGSGNVYVTGLHEISSGGEDYATIKYDLTGKQRWMKRYNGTGNGRDEAMAIALDASGNVYITGQSKGSGTDYDYVTIKY